MNESILWRVIQSILISPIHSTKWFNALLYIANVDFRRLSIFFRSERKLWIFSSRVLSFIEVLPPLVLSHEKSNFKPFFISFSTFSTWAWRSLASVLLIAFKGMYSQWFFTPFHLLIMEYHLLFICFNCAILHSQNEVENTV